MRIKEEEKRALGAGQNILVKKSNNDRKAKLTLRISGFETVGVFTFQPE